MIEFSVAEKINVHIDTASMSRVCVDFLKMIYKDFAVPVESPLKVLRVRVADIKAPEEDLVKLGGDAFYNSGVLYLASGHFYKKIGNELEVVIPTRVKRGRVPFRRSTPGRHVSDEIIEPLLVILLQGMGISCYHASSILGEDGEAVVNIAWRGTGKTDAVLPYIFEGSVLSDDLSLVDEVEGVLYAYPRPLRLYRYNIDRLSIDDAAKAKLRLKSKVTPPWQPVKYISLNPNQLSVKKYRKVYLNELRSKVCHGDSFNMDELFKNITDFEFSYFDSTKAMLEMARVI